MNHVLVAAKMTTLVETNFFTCDRSGTDELIFLLLSDVPAPDAEEEAPDQEASGADTTDEVVRQYIQEHIEDADSPEEDEQGEDDSSDAPEEEDEAAPDEAAPISDLIRCPSTSCVQQFMGTRRQVNNHWTYHHKKKENLETSFLLAMREANPEKFPITCEHCGLCLSSPIAYKWHKKRSH